MTPEAAYSNPKCQDLREQIANVVLYFSNIDFLPDLDDEKYAERTGELDHVLAEVVATYASRPGDCLMQEIIPSELYDCGRCRFRAEIFS